MIGLAKIILEASILSILIASSTVKTIDPNAIFSSSIVNIPTESVQNTEMPTNVNISSIFNTNSIINTNPLKIQYIPVGNGEAILITANGYTMLLDGGENTYEKEFLSYLRNAHISKIDHLVVTSLRDENLGLLDNLIKNVNVEKIYSPKVTSEYLNSDDYNNILIEMEKKNKNFTTAKTGNTFTLGDANITFLHANNDMPEELDSASIVLKLDYKGKTFLFASNINKETEREIAWPKADVLKVASKGKKGTTEYNTIVKIKPEYAVIIKDDIGHDPKVEENIKKLNGKVLFSDINKIVQITYDGTNFNQEQVQNTINR